MQFQLFDPGENVILPVPSCRSRPRSERVSAEFPARIHMTPIDCNRFDFGRPGGGGCGFAIKSPNKVIIQLSQEECVEAPTNQIPVVLHYLQIMRRIYQYEGNFKVTISMDDMMTQHFGLG